MQRHGHRHQRHRSRRVGRGQHLRLAVRQRQQQQRREQHVEHHHPQQELEKDDRRRVLGAVDQHDQRLRERNQHQQHQRRRLRCAAARGADSYRSFVRTSSVADTWQQHRVQAVVDHVGLGRQVQRQRVRADQRERDPLVQQQHLQVGGQHGEQAGEPQPAARVEQVACLPRAARGAWAGAAASRAAACARPAPNVTSDVPMPRTTSALSRSRRPTTASASASAAVRPC